VGLPADLSLHAPALDDIGALVGPIAACDASSAAWAPVEASYARVGRERDGRRHWHPPLGLSVVGYHRRLG
jgi:hypothetical protein